MKNILRNIYYFIISKLPMKIVVNFENLRTYKRIVPKDNPKYFGEKIQWLKLYGHLEKYNNYVDKYKVREYVKNTIGEEYLIPIIKIYKTSEDFKIEELPNSFVLKNNNGSGMNYIVKDKAKINQVKIRKMINKWLKSKYYKIKKENQYINVENMVICEKYLEDKKGELLDYKFFCFDGEPIMLKVDYDRYSNHTANYYDMKWNLLDLQEQEFKNNSNFNYKPKNFEEMKLIAAKLSKKFQFVRVDLYNIDGKIYFGELTFTPASGKHAFFPLEKDIEIARRIKIG